MPSSLSQQVIILSGKKKKNGNQASDIIIVKKTGYLNLWVNGTHFYYNYVGQYPNASDIDIQKIVQNYQDQQNRKQVIVIRRK